MTTDPVLDIAKAYVVDKFTEAQAAQDPAVFEAIVAQVAAIIVGPHKPTLLEHAEASIEQMNAQKATLAVQKRFAEKQIDHGIALARAARDALAPPNRQQRRTRK